MRELARILSEAAGHGVRIATIWPSLGQMRERYGGASDTIRANSTAQRFIGPITDDATRRYLVELLGNAPPASDDRPSLRPKARAAALSAAWRRPSASRGGVDAARDRRDASVVAGRAAAPPRT